ncbi:hypothetical protein Lal_00012415 [Lupinus albus]|nr:hypothetical protein Lal_00012415 [Lupinus albus]
MPFLAQARQFSLRRESSSIVQDFTLLVWCKFVAYITLCFPMQKNITMKLANKQKNITMKLTNKQWNLKEIVLRSNLYGYRDTSIFVKGPRYVTAQDILLPPSMEIDDNTQHIANLIEPINLCIRLRIVRGRICRIKTLTKFPDRSYFIDVVFMYVRNVNHSILSYVNGNEKQE